MSEKKPDLPIVHLPWSAWQDITARLDALEADVAALEAREKARGQRVGYAAAPPPPAAAPAPDVIERVREALKDAMVQIEFMHEKFQTTGSGETTIARINEALRLLGDAP